MAPDYEVTLDDGATLVFDARGRWQRIERPGGGVPEELLPARAARYLAANNPGARVASLERDGRGWRVWLDNGLGLRFDRQGRMAGF